MEKQIKSKQRVKELAEVFTNEREVNAMLDLVEDYSYDISKKFLEPACGNGNFLIKILERKLSVIEKDDKYSILISLSNIYGVDICPENVQESKARLIDGVISFYGDVDDDFLNKIKYILDSNIILGNTLEDNLKFIEFTPNGVGFNEKESFLFDMLSE